MIIWIPAQHVRGISHRSLFSKNEALIFAVMPEVERELEETVDHVVMNNPEAGIHIKNRSAPNSLLFH